MVKLNSSFLFFKSRDKLLRLAVALTFPTQITGILIPKTGINFTLTVFRVSFVSLLSGA
jgi:hypothetical protein